MFEVETIPAFSSRVNAERGAVVPRRQGRAEDVKWRPPLFGVVETGIVAREASAADHFDDRFRPRLADHRDVHPFGDVAVAPQRGHGGLRVASAQRDGRAVGAVLGKSQLAGSWGVPVVGLVEPYPEHQRLGQSFADQRLGEPPCCPGRFGEPRGEHLSIHPANLLPEHTASGALPVA